MLFKKPSAGWLSRIRERGYIAFEGYEANIPVGENTTGYRVFYEDAQGNLRPPLSTYDRFQAWDTGEEISTQRNQGAPQYAGQVNHSPTDEGYYYWHDKEVAEAYMYTILADMYYKYKDRPLLQGRFIMREVQGIATRHPSGQAGDVMEDMYIGTEDLASVTWAENME